MFYNADNTILEFHDDYNQSLDQVKFPDALQSITFGEKFNQSLDQVKFPDSLQTIIFVIMDKNNNIINAL